MKTTGRFVLRAMLPVMAALLLLGGCVEMQEEIIRLDERVDALEQQGAQQSQAQSAMAARTSSDLGAQLENLSQEQNATERQLREQNANLGARLDQLFQELRQLRGAVEESEHRLQRQVSQLSKAEKDFQLRLGRLEQARAETRAAAAAPAAPAAPLVEAAPQPMTADDLYQAGKAAFDRGAYDEARGHFETIIAKLPQSTEADNAQFWVGEIYYRQKEYERAILEYQKVIENYPDGNKVRASLLKQGFSFFNLDDRANARLILDELIKKHPDSIEAKIAQQKIKTFD